MRRPVGSAEVHHGRRLVTERLVRPLVVVELEVATQVVSGLAGCRIFGEVDLLVLDRAPQALGEDVVARSTAAIHADLHAGREQQVEVLRTGEVAALVAVPDLGRGLRQGPLGTLEHKGQCERVGQLPGDHVATVPIQHGHQVEPAGQQADVGDVDAPNVVGVAGGDMAQKIRKNPVFGVALAGVGSGTDARDAHLAHMALDGLAVDHQLGPQHRPDLARAVEGMGSVHLVDAPLDRQLFRAGGHRLVVETGAVEGQQVALGLQAQIARVAFQQGQAFSAGQVRGQIFF